LGVEQLAGARLAADLLDVRVARILFVEPTQGGCKPLRVAGLEVLSRNDSI
jgi:hypothetical protein